MNYVLLRSATGMTTSLGQHTSKNTMSQMRQIWIRTANGARDLKDMNCILRITPNGWFREEKI